MADIAATLHCEFRLRQAAYIHKQCLKMNIMISRGSQGNPTRHPVHHEPHTSHSNMPLSAVDVAPPSAGESFSLKSQVKTIGTILPTQAAKIESRLPLTIDELVRQRSQEIPREAIISYPSSGLEYVDYTTRQIDIFAHRVAQKYKILIPQRLSSSDPETVVGLLGPSNFEYFISILALTKLGHTVLFMSTRISIAAYVSLLKATGAKHILINSSFRETAAQVKENCNSIEVHDITETESV